jgi:hypothetical protein
VRDKLRDNRGHDPAPLRAWAEPEQEQDWLFSPVATAVGPLTAGTLSHRLTHQASRAQNADYFRCLLLGVTASPCLQISLLFAT